MILKGEPCKYCYCTQYVEGKQDGYATVYGDSGFSGTSLHYIVCRNCGTVVRSYVKEPEKLLKKRDRRK